MPSYLISNITLAKLRTGVSLERRGISPRGVRDSGAAGLQSWQRQANATAGQIVA
jgi:hypothetical protein